MSAWTTRVAGIAELRTQMQDDASPQRYSDTELGKALDEAIAELSAARPILTTVAATLDSSRVVRLDNVINSVFGAVVAAVEVGDDDTRTPVFGWYYFEQTSQHKVLMPSSLGDGDTVEILVRGAYGFSVSIVTGSGSVTSDTNIPAEWRERIIQGAQGYALELYGAREVGRTNVAPAVAQQTARAAAVKLRDFRQWIAGLPFADAQRQIVTWGLQAVDNRTSDHRGFD